MSRQLLIDSLSPEIRDKVSKDLQIRQEPSKYAYGARPTFIYPLEVVSNNAYVPFAYNHTFPRPPRETFPSTRYRFDGKLRPPQKKARIEAISHLNKYGSTIIACHPGWGKTCTAINIASKIKLKTLIIVHRVILVNQWKSSIEKFCPDSIPQILHPGDEMDPQADFYIMNAINIPKNSRRFYKSIGFLIVDEAHLIMAEQLSKSMLYFVPRYVLGLSATPYRMDGLNILFDLYFGTKKIEHKLWHRHSVYTIESGFVPEVELAKNGKVNWNTVLTSQCMDPERNEMIIRLIKFFPKRVFLVLCKRVAQARHLVRRLQEEKEDVTSLIGSQQHYGHDSRILVASSSKAGVGFDHPRLNALILASDIEQYFVQFLGRIFRTEKGEPLIFDIVDVNPILRKHYSTRRAVYIEHGGTVKSFNKTYPDFPLCNVKKKNNKR